jgi:hypothetical protein
MSSHIIHLAVGKDIQINEVRSYVASLLLVDMFTFSLIIPATVVIAIAAINDM